MKKPWITINCAMSLDGKIALPSRQPIKISNEDDMRRVHGLRNECDAILVGIGTVLADNSHLIVKEKYVKNPSQPLRIVLDSDFRIPKNAKILDNKAPTLVVTTCKEEKKGNIEIIKCPSKDGKISLKKLMKVLYIRGIKKLMVEGGETIIWEFLKEGIVDELHVFIAPFIIGGVTSPTLAGGNGARLANNVIHFNLKNIEYLGNGLLLILNPLA